MYTNNSTFFKDFLASNFFYLTSEIWPTCSAVACPQFYNSSTIDWTQLSTKASIYVKQSLYFWIIVKLSSYRSIGLCINIIYILFIVELSYEDQIQNVNTTLKSFGLSVILCTFLADNKSIHQTKILFFLHSIPFYGNARTIDLTFYDIIIHSI